MDYDYSRYPNPETQNDHQFLKNLYSCSKNATEETITQIAKKCFDMGNFGSLFFNARKTIANSVEVLMKEVTVMPLFSEAQQEIDGAINGLNLLLKNENDEFKQMEIQKTLQRVGLYKQIIGDVFFIKEVTKTRPELSHIVHDVNFTKDFRALTSLYGRKRKIDIPLVQSFILVWMNPELTPILQNFLQDVLQARKSNLTMLEKGQLPLIESEHNQKMAMMNSQLLQAVQEKLKEADRKNFKILIDDLFHKSVVTNTQIHADGISLAFNAEAKDTLSKRTKKTTEHGEETYEQTMQQLEGLVQDLSADQNKVEKEIENWKKLKGYHSRPVGMLYQKATWMPMIGPNEPICPLIRTIGFATQEGAKNESSISLDFTKAFLNSDESVKAGEENLKLSIEEREKLSQLLLQCDTAVLLNPTVVRSWNENRELPENVKNVLMQFDNDQLPHLKNLTPVQREMLVSEALRFAFEVNYHLARDLLTL